MKKCSGCQVELPSSAFCKDRSRKDGLNHRCRECANAHVAKYRETHLEALLAYSKKYELARSGSRKEYKLAYYNANKERGAAYQREWLAANSEYVIRRYKAYYEANKVQVRLKCIKWVVANPARVSYLQSKRRVAKKNASAAWANQEAIMAVYSECRRISAATGVVHHVDHIVPLQHPLVCGLHVENNLQVITATNNCAKGNRFTPGFQEAA